jgi:hypothetical protein
MGRAATGPPPYPSVVAAGAAVGSSRAGAARGLRTAAYRAWRAPYAGHRQPRRAVRSSHSGVRAQDAQYVAARRPWRAERAKCAGGVGPRAALWDVPPILYVGRSVQI